MKKKLLNKLEYFSHEVVLFAVINVIFGLLCLGVRELILYLR